ncbi:class I SAM-dependent methyltransferase [Paenibacillus tarimensis]|uniref:class I SAM-dependent methyltransferase n=1 Tax=Paenibacillus tarimensis TaxID=416012 RepID=UPI001F190602|nr:SAM-dependent methyltransferase [Paenibacillus tarimensis]MCF2943654.1 SAM-dependent methyltransferase [Paenibacillus tarimensis]
MDNWRDQVMGWLKEAAVIQATLSQLRVKSLDAPAKVMLRPVVVKGETVYQLEHHKDNKAIHENLKLEDAAVRVADLMEHTYRQALIKTEEADVQLLFSKKGKATMLRKPPTASGKVSMSHNREKNRIIAEGVAAPFLVELGIMTKEGRVHAQKQDKFRQINRFLEMVVDVLDALPKNKELTVIDFGCGKSYLTFALYHLLVIQEKLPVRIIGLDLKKDVIAFCSGLAAKLGYDKLQFLHGDIAEYSGLEQADMVVTLHACDTATDAALAKAVCWNASVILSVPCCQHELFGQVDNGMLSPLLSHGILKERFASLATDAVRSQLLQVIGYKVQLLEFIDMEHTPKNILIRATKAGQGAAHNIEKWKEYLQFREGLCLSPYLEKVLQDRLPASN